MTNKPADASPAMCPGCGRGFHWTGGPWACADCLSGSAGAMMDDPYPCERKGCVGQWSGISYTPALCPACTAEWSGRRSHSIEDYRAFRAEAQGKGGAAGRVE